MNRIYPPLLSDHPAITGNVQCPFCHSHFFRGDRTTLIEATSELPAAMPAIIAHARCALKGARNKLGEILTIVDGDSPYPIILTNGKCLNVDEWEEGKRKSRK